MPASSHIRRAQRPQLPQQEPGLGWVPPDETIWQRYSRNGEPMISGLGSLLMHVALLAIVLTGIWAIFDRGGAPDLVEVEPIGVDNGDSDQGGGLANKNGKSLDPGAMPVVDDRKPVDPAAKPSRPTPDNEPVVGPSRPPENKGVIEEAVKEKLGAAAQQPRARKVVDDVLSPVVGAGAYGPSSDRSTAGNKDGPGLGNRNGPSIARHSKTWARMQRWELVFSTNDARHYVQQLESLDAIVAVVNLQEQVFAVRDLKERPAQLERRDLVSLGRMYWVDDRLDSVASVAAELGLSFTPTAIVAFFPKSFQDELLAKELGYAGLKEEQIATTRFSITFRGGKSIVRVLDQQRKK
jgi:hypothetical protein